MTAAERAIAHRLQRVTMPVASFDKRFRRAMVFLLEHEPTRELSERQAAYLVKLDHRYRRQTGGAHICTALCATYTRRQAGECFDAELPATTVHLTRVDRTFLQSIGVSADPHAALPLFDQPTDGDRE